MSEHRSAVVFVATWLATNPDRGELLKVLIDIAEASPFTVKTAIRRMTNHED